jgi:hypothetical protein
MLPGIKIHAQVPFFPLLQVLPLGLAPGNAGYDPGSIQCVALKTLMANFESIAAGIGVVGLGGGASHSQQRSSATIHGASYCHKLCVRVRYSAAACA